MATNETANKKKQLLRNNEYYSIQEVLDNLYERSNKGQNFNNLLNLITSEQNILLAFRNIKNNKGSKTKGVNDSTIISIGTKNPNILVEYVRNRLINYKPQAVRRVEIPKPNGKTRPLGIPTIEDRLIQQCIKQILEPICEAKFHNHSYGFRPNRSTHHAIARTMYLMNKSKLHYAVDIDIVGFFDNVNHSKLLKQMWNMGIQDKNLICIISKLLKAEIKGKGIPSKGTPQGGILSPLLSNIVLNELDWWISNQWETHHTNFNYKNSGDRLSAQKKTNLKEMYIIRYADDFKILCRNYKTANKIFIATKNWLKERLGLEISPEKSKIINLRKNYSDFLGFKLKVIPKGKKMVTKSHISDKSKKKIIIELKSRIKDMQANPNIKTVNTYNSTILGMHNYYRIASMVNIDFQEINFLVSKNLINRLRLIQGEGFISNTQIKYYGKYKFKQIFVAGIGLFPIAGITTRPPMNFSQEVSNYTENGRNLIHTYLKEVSPNMLRYLMSNPVVGKSVEYNDNRISLFVGQNGKCGITGANLEIENMEVHHKIPINQGGNDKYQNLILITKNIHKLIHATNYEIITQYICQYKLYDNLKFVDKINKLRKLVGNCEI